MEDYLNEKEQWEQLLQGLRQQLPSALAILALAGLAYGGWQYWQSRQQASAYDASSMYAQIRASFNRNDIAGGLQLTDALVAKHPGSAYADQAELMAAGAAVDKLDLPQAASRLRRVQASSDATLRLVARLRLARVLLAQNQADEALKLLTGVDAGAFAARYAEARGDVLYAKGDRPGALREYKTAREGDPATVDTAVLDLKISQLAGT